MKQSKTTLKELTAAYRAVLRHGILCNAIALGLMVATPAMAGDPTTGDAWVFGDVSFTDQHVATGAAAFGGRRLADSNVSGKYHNVFPQYNMVGQSFALSNSDAYFGPITLTLDTLDETDNFAFNWQAPDGTGVADMDIAAAAQIGWGESTTDSETIIAQVTTIRDQLTTAMTTIFSEEGYTGETLNAKVAEAVGGAYKAVYAMSRTDTDTTNDGLLALDNVDAVVDGAKITADKISVTNGSNLTVDKQDTTLLNTSAVFYTNKADIVSDGVTTLNADEINIDGSKLDIKPGATLVLNPEGTGSTVVKNVVSDYGAITMNKGGSLLVGGESLLFDNNTSTSHGAALYFKDQTAGDNAARLIANNITFSNNTSNYSASSGGGVFSTGGNMSILGATNTFTGNKILGTDVAAKLHKRGGGAVANQSYEVEGVHTPIDATMVIGYANDTSTSTNIFTENTSSMNGGAIMNRAVDTDGNAYLTINGTTTFENNHANINGGAIYNFADAGKVAEVNLTNGTYTFTENTATRGGAIYNSGIMNIVNGEFVDNNATVTGGAVFSTGKLTVTDSLFEGNTADYGAAIRTVVNAPSTLTISGTTFRNNHANENGAVGIFDKSAASSITNSHFINNYTTFNDADAYADMSEATQNQMEGAGALSLGSESLVTISGTEFKNNYTTLGGGAISTRTTAQNNVGEKLDITNSTFIGNKAGVIYDATSDSVSASNFANIRGFGGAIYANVWNNKKGEGFATISDSTFTKNEAYNGGAIYNDAADGKVGNIKLTNSSFTSNIASENGGAIYNEGVLTLAGINKFTGNKAGNNANDIHNVGDLTIASGTTTINGGITGNGDLTIDSGATLNIGTASITQDTITLNGNMTATLTKDAEDAQINAQEFDGDGKLALTMAETGTYHVFGGKADFDIEDLTWNVASGETGVSFTDKVVSSVYNLSWDGGDVTASSKTADEIVAGSEISKDSATAVAAVVESASNSSSKQMKELSVKLQEKLAEAESNPAAKEVVEHATKAIHPETESVVQSVSTSVQNTIVNLASSRMAAPIIGRNGGDTKLTSGGVWAQGLYNRSKQADAFNGYTRGIALGLDGTINKRWTIGAGYSFAHSDISGSARDTAINSNTVFVYGQYKPSQWYLNAIANYTSSDYSEKGTVIDNTPIFADYSVKSYGGNVATGYNFNTGITPELGLRYIHVTADDYTNSFGVKTHMDNANFLTGILGAKYAFNVVAGKYTTFMPQLNAGFKYDLLSDKNIATVTMPGINSYTMDGERLSRIGGEFGIGLGMKYRNLDIALNYDIDVRKDYTSQTGMLKLRCNF